MNLGAFAAGLNGDVETGPQGFPVYQTARQLQFRPVSKKVGAVILYPLRAQTNQRMQMPAVRPTTQTKTQGAVTTSSPGSILG
jgi:hypothetical protein